MIIERPIRFLKNRLARERIVMARWQEVALGKLPRCEIERHVKHYLVNVLKQPL